ncbi:MAG: hypothetical protein JW814_03005 [Candidatus Krumholzibacteriota bacterium]|nr:hypothetical protein [Candidatus Krumholzibacteriota bacterium]
MARWASFIDSRRAISPVLLLDTGDFFRPEKTPDDEIDYPYFFEGMRLLRYDAVNVGANDLLYGREIIAKAAKDADLPLLSSNIIDRRSGDLLAAPFMIRDLGGKKTILGRKGAIRTGIFSLTDRSFFDMIENAELDNYNIKEPAVTALEAVSRLRGKKCDLIIAISHLGWEKSVRLAETVPGIDIVINGHRGHDGTFQQRTGSTLVVDTGLHRISLTEIEVRFTNGKLLTRASDVGGVALRMPGRKDLAGLEERYLMELEQKGIEDKRENTVEVE